MLGFGTYNMWVTENTAVMATLMVFQITKKEKNCSNFGVEELNTWGDELRAAVQDELQQVLPDTGFLKSTLQWLETWITQMNINKKQS